VPRMEEDVERLYSIEGQPPALWDLPEGCRFAPRCEFAMERCRLEYPRSFAVKEDGPEHAANCWLLDAASGDRAQGPAQSLPGKEPHTVAIERKADATGRRVGGSFG
jgi:oligopeptide/dipeptide ABC transporter ATP-binding protein